MRSTASRMTDVGRKAGGDGRKIFAAGNRAGRGVDGADAVRRGSATRTNVGVDFGGAAGVADAAGVSGAACVASTVAIAAASASVDFAGAGSCSSAGFGGCAAVVCAVFPRQKRCLTHQ